MVRKTHRELAQAFIDALGYAEDERVRAVYLVGSSASGENDAYSDVDVMVVVDEIIPDAERLRALQAIGGRNIMLVIAGAENPALPVQSQVIDKLIFRDTWFDVSYHLPHQLEFSFDYVVLLDKDNLTPHLAMVNDDYTEEDLLERAQADLRLLHVRIYRYDKYARREEWVGIDVSAIKNAIVDLLMVLNDQPHYNRHSSRLSQLLDDQPVKPENLERDLLDILHLDNRTAWAHKVDLMGRLEADLAALCEARWGAIPMFDDET
jgi:predicted nucleotidyltransferase